MMKRIVEVNNLSKSYRMIKKKEGILGTLQYLLKPEYEEKEAVKDISFSINEGESVAFLGANGAGKSTTIKMLTGIMKPTSGNIKILGNEPFKNRIENARNIGVIFGQKTQLWWDIPIIETFHLLKDIYEVPDDIYEENMRQFKDILQLDSFFNVPARKLSLGQRVRADMAAALIHNPSILFLDEPTIGLDVAVKQKVYEFLRYINLEKGTTILLTSHDLNDLESLCQRLMIIEQGKMLFDDKIKKIYESYPNEKTLEDIVIDLFNRRL